MGIQSWQVITWPTVTATADELLQAVKQFRHFGTSLQLESDASVLCSGSTVWGCEFSGKRLGLAWEWVEVRPKVIAMQDPMTLLSNVDVTDGSTVLENSGRLLKLHEVIFALPWQHHVNSARWTLANPALAA